VKGQGADGPALIREAREDDLSHLAAMIDTLSAHHGATTTVGTRALMRDLLGPQPWAFARVAERDGKTAGYAISYPLYFAQWGERGMHLHHLYIDPLHRGLGLGTQLTLAMIDLARALGCTYVSVTAEPDNVNAQRFYEGLGMRTSPVTGLRFAMDI
tara:strand:+ start:2809 stop:3279 length:471 start_codon:yes stop_codon:yes gene_type:complete